MLKKLMCKLMAFVFVVGSVSAFNLEKTEVKAEHDFKGEDYFRYNHTDRLALSPFERKDDRASTDLSEVVFSWPAITNPAATMNGGTYTLTYAYNDSYYVTVDFFMTQTEMVATYRQIEITRNPDGTIASEAPKVLYDYTNPNPVKGLMYFVPIPEGVEETQLTAGNEYGGGRFGLSDPTKLVYTVPKDGNGAFRFVNTVNGIPIETVKLLWNRADSRIYFSTDKAAPGLNIYQFNLKGKTIGGDDYSMLGSEGKTFRVSTGYGADLMETVNFSHSVEGGMTIDKTLATTSEALWPGQNTELKFEIVLPKIWNSTTKRFETVTAGVSDKDKVGMSFNIRRGATSFAIRVDNMAAALPQNTATGKYTHVAGKGTLVIDKLPDDLPAGMIFRNTSFKLETTPTASGTATVYDEITSDATEFGENFVYTLPSYRISQPSLKSCILEITSPFRLSSQTNSKNILGKYLIYRGNNATSLNLLQTVSILEGINDVGNISVSLPLTVDDPSKPAYFYKVVFEVPHDSITEGRESDRLESQTVKHAQTESLDSLQVPQNLIVESSRTINAIDDATGKLVQYVKTRLSFSTGPDEIFQHLADLDGDGVVEYMIYSSAEPKNLSPDELISVKLALRDEDDSGASVTDIDVSLADGSDVTDTKKFYPIDASYDPALGIVTIEFLAKAAVKTGQTGNIAPEGYVFVSPNIYYLKARGSMNQANSTDFSSEVVFDISSPQEYTVPSPVLATIDTQTGETFNMNVTENSFDLSYNLNNSSLFEFMDYILNPQKMTLGNDSLSYDVYISTSFDDMKALAEGEIIANIRTIPYDGGAWGGSIDFSKITGAFDFLRNGGTYHITGVPTQTPFDPANRNNPGTGYITSVLGLDDNTAYYSMSQTIVKPHSATWKNGIPGIIDSVGTLIAGKKYVSDFTSIVSATTKVQTSGPAPEEFSPPAPVITPDNIPPKNVTDTLIELEWNLPALPQGINRNNFEFEILRVKASTVSKDLLGDKEMLSEVLKAIKAGAPSIEAFGFRTDEKDADDALMRFDVTGSQSANAPVTFTGGQTRNVLSDTDVSPSTMYVYYIRTVMKKDATKTGVENILKYSVWVPVSATTDSIKRPINLSYIDDSAIDLNDEVLIGFQAPAPKASVAAGDYRLEYSVKGDVGDWITKPLTTSLLIDGETPVNGVPGYYHYRYKITGLEPGKPYMLRVRIISINQSTGAETVSDWSELLSHRTEVDPNLPDDPTDSWHDYFKEQLEELLKKPYWPISSNRSTTFEAVYKGSSANGLLASESIITLGKEGVATQIYYIPAEMMAKALAAQKSFRVISHNTSTIIPASVVDSMQTQAVKDILKAKSDNKIRDYYVALSVLTSPTSERIAGNPALTDRVSLSVKMVGFTKPEIIWDAEMFNSLSTYVQSDANFSRQLTRISNAVANGTSDTDMVKLIETLVDDVYADLTDKTRESFNDTRLYEYTAASFTSPVRITAQTAQAAQQAQITQASGYSLVSGQWQSVTTTPYGTGFSMLTTLPGVFVFAGASINIPGINNMQNGDAISSFVLKYGLDDFFGKGNSFSTAQTLSNDALIGAVARMAGAQKTQDAAAFLRGKGMTVSTRNAYQPANNETTVYMLMSLYEIKTNTKVSSIRITNHNALNGITGINAAYLPHYKAAYQTGILNKQLMPKQQMTVGEFLDIAGRLAGKINL